MIMEACTFSINQNVKDPNYKAGAGNERRRAIVRKYIDQGLKGVQLAGL